MLLEISVGFEDPPDTGIAIYADQSVLSVDLIRSQKDPTRGCAWCMARRAVVLKYGGDAREGGVRRAGAHGRVRDPSIAARRAGAGTRPARAQQKRAIGLGCKSDWPKSLYQKRWRGAKAAQKRLRFNLQKYIV